MIIDVITPYTGNSRIGGYIMEGEDKSNNSGEISRNQFE